MNLLEKIDELRAQSVTPEKFDKVWGVSIEDHLDRLMEFVAEQEFTAKAGGGAVEITCNGKKEIKKVHLEKDVVDPDDVEMLEDLIMAAINEAFKQADDASGAVMNKLTGGLGGLPF